MVDLGNGPQRYRVDCSDVIRDEIRRLHRLATAYGEGETLTDAFRHVLHRLESNPLDFGEAMYRLPGLRLEVRTGIVPPLIINFAISEDHPSYLSKA